MKYKTISVRHFFPAKGAISYVAIATVIFSEDHVFAWKLTLYFIDVYIIKRNISIVCALFVTLLFGFMIVWSCKDGKRNR